MKIKKIAIENIGPFRERQEFDFTDSFSQETERFLLLSGFNGSGKTTLLNAIANLWEATGIWLTTKKKLSNKKVDKKIKNFFGEKGCFSMFIEDFPDFSKNDGSTCTLKLYYGLDYIEKKATFQIGEQRDPSEKTSTLSWPSRNSISGILLKNKDDILFFNAWSEEYKKLTITGTSKTPNILYLDAEERRWVTPEKNIGELVQVNHKERWLYKYQASTLWETQLEASLIALKTVELHNYHKTIKLLNTVLKNKEIEPDISAEDMRLRVYILKNGRKNSIYHYLDELSAGERDLLTLLYSVSRWMEKGGIVLLDEPDVFLHTSILSNFFAPIEKIIKEKKGQLIISSHQSRIWERYEIRSKRVDLSEVQK